MMRAGAHNKEGRRSKVVSGWRQALNPTLLGTQKRTQAARTPSDRMYEPMHLHENEAPNEMGPPVYEADEREGYGGVGTAQQTCTQVLFKAGAPCKSGGVCGSGSGHAIRWGVRGRMGGAQ